jgi:hypothetical protein
MQVFLSTVVKNSTIIGNLEAQMTQKDLRVFGKKREDFGTETVPSAKLLKFPTRP